MKISTYTQNGKESGKTELPSEIFDVKLNLDLVHQAAAVQMANQRQVIAHTKIRSEVRGGGRKPWRQKGTGRARHGSIRSPLWKGGGVTFGPRKNRNYSKKINKKMKRKALFMVLSSKVKDKEIAVLDDLKISQPKTKEMAAIITQISKGAFPKAGKKESFLIALPKIDEDIIKAAGNISKTATIQAKDLNVLDLLIYKYLIMPKEAIEVIEKTFAKNEKQPVRKVLTTRKRTRQSKT